jgi:hypothetical protein
VFLLCKEFVEVFVGNWIPMFCRWINFEIQKILANFFCVAIMLELFSTKVWVNIKCFVVCFGFYVVGWFCRSFVWATNIVHSWILVCFWS